MNYINECKLNENRDLPTSLCVECVFIQFPCSLIIFNIFTRLSRDDKYNILITFNIRGID